MSIALEVKVRALEALVETQARRLKAYAVLTLIKREPPPSLRRVQEILRELRAESAASR